MTSNSARLLKLTGIGAGILGVIGLAVVLTPLVYGEVRAQAAQPLVQWKQHVLGGTSVGVDVRDVDETDVKREKLQTSTGVVVENVRSDGPGAKAGLKAGDVIVAFDGERVRSAAHFRRLVSETPDGRSVDMAVMRAGSKVTLKVTVDTVDPFEPLRTYSYRFNRPEAFTMNMPKLEGFYSGTGPRLSLFSRGRLGVGVQNLTEQLGEYFGTSTGALVTAVDEGTPAKAAGIKAGDVITKINGDAVSNEADLRRKLNAASGETRITVMRDRKEITLTAKIQDQ